MSNRMSNRIESIKSAEEAIIEYFYMLNEESKNVTEIIKDKEIQHELLNLFQRAYPFPLESIPLSTRTKKLRAIGRSRCNYITKKIINRKNELNILDAGCGWGIYSTFFSLLGANTIGVDLRGERINVANARGEYYKNNYDVKGNLLFLFKNIFSLDYKEEFNIIWATEAISHISPADKFLEKSYEMLKTSGEIIIADPNGLYIPTQIMLLKHRGLKLYYTRKDPETGLDVEYANERIFSLYQITKMLRKAGFKVVYRHGSIGFHKRANDYIYNKFIFALERTSIISDILASYYVISGKKV